MEEISCFNLIYCQICAAVLDTIDDYFSSLKKHCDYTASMHRMKCTIPPLNGKYLLQNNPTESGKRYDLLLFGIS